jgi:hypothetical protein
MCYAKQQHSRLNVEHRPPPSMSAAAMMGMLASSLIKKGGDGSQLM